MRVRHTIAAGIVSLAAAAGSAQAAPIVLVNHGFESGLTGWNTLGSVATSPDTVVTTYDSTTWTINADGTEMAQMVSYGSDQGSIEAFFGILAGSLSAGNANPDDGGLTSGSAISQSFTGAVGDTLTMFWNYVATDYIPFNDPAYAVLVAPDGTYDITVLASIHGLGNAVGTSGNSGWAAYNAVLSQAGTYTIGFATFNDKDTILPSYLHLDAQPGTCEPSCPIEDGDGGDGNQVPEPGTFALLGLGLAAAVRARARRERQ